MSSLNLTSPGVNIAHASSLNIAIWRIASYESKYEIIAARAILDDCPSNVETYSVRATPGSPDPIDVETLIRFPLTSKAKFLRLELVELEDKCEPFAYAMLPFKDYATTAERANIMRVTMRDSFDDKKIVCHIELLMRFESSRLTSPRSHHFIPGPPFVRQPHPINSMQLVEKYDRTSNSRSRRLDIKIYKVCHLDPEISSRELNLKLVCGTHQTRMRCKSRGTDLDAIAVNQQAIMHYEGHAYLKFAIYDGSRCLGENDYDLTNFVTFRQNVSIGCVKLYSPPGDNAIRVEVCDVHYRIFRGHDECLQDFLGDLPLEEIEPV